jgi:hypothetical protein
LARFSKAMTSALLAAFSVALAFLVPFRARFGAASGALPLVLESMVSSLILLLLTARCGRHIHHSGSEKQQVESATNIRRGEVLAAGWQSAGLIPFL